MHARSKGEHRWPRVYEALRQGGVKVGKERVRQLMKLHGITARTKRKFKATTGSTHALLVAPNFSQRNFMPIVPNAVWGTDITYIATDEGWLDLAVMLDLFNRQVVG